MSNEPSPPGPVDGNVPLPLTTSRPELLHDGRDDAFRELVHDLLAFGARIREIRDLLGSIIGLSGPAYTTLITIAHLERHGTVTVTSVSQHLNVSQPFATVEVGKLATDGLVEKSRSTTDRRSVSLTVTEAGRDLLVQLAPDQREINDTLFASLDSDRFEMLSATIATMIADADRTLRLAADRATAERDDIA